MKVAALEDDVMESRLIYQTISQAGHECTVFNTGRAMIDTLSRQRFDLLILDWHLPDMTGKEVIEWVRNHLGDRVLVMFLTNRLLEENIVEGLMAGADDYMTKPIRQAELTARVHALSKRLRRNEATTQAELAAHAIVEVGPYRIDTKMKIITVNGQKVDLKPKEFDIARILFQNAGQLITRERIMAEVWGRELVMTSRTLDTHMSQVRTKLHLKPDNKAKLTTIYTIGYRLDILN